MPAGDRGPTEGSQRPARSPIRVAARIARLGADATRSRLTVAIGGSERTRVVTVLAGVLALSSADAATVGAAAIELRQHLHINNTDIGLLVAVSSLVGAIASVPFGMLADRVRRTWTLSAAVVLWGVAMLCSAAVGSFGELLLARLALGVVTAAAGPIVASLVGDYVPGGERGRIYSFILIGELVGAGTGFAVTGDVAALSWARRVRALGRARVRPRVLRFRAAGTCARRPGRVGDRPRTPNADAGRRRS